jgi:hypothetical protein
MTYERAQLASVEMHSATMIGAQETHLGTKKHLHMFALVHATYMYVNACKHTSQGIHMQFKHMVYQKPYFAAAGCRLPKSYTQHFLNNYRLTQIGRGGYLRPRMGKGGFALLLGYVGTVAGTFQAEH